ncbi:membrane protein BRI3-like [Heteronotia binoei]|uniref:membrane protein BRI3-like n=1 Tax=Heteronotia binoei TaxID=13085 RepID=UPI00292E48FE|nr:membrane protein BRI3-like [Heteronotia binoei]
MDNKPLLQDRPPAYSPAAQGGGYEYGQQGGYGTIPSVQPGFQPPPYTYPTGSPAAYAVPPAASPHAYPNTTYTIIQQPTTTTSVVVVGGCQHAESESWKTHFTCLGVFCAIAFFPIGILFCLALRQRRCPNCGATFG